MVVQCILRRMLESYPLKNIRTEYVFVNFEDGMINENNNKLNMYF